MLNFYSETLKIIFKPCCGTSNSQSDVTVLLLKCLSPITTTLIENEIMKLASAHNGINSTTYPSKFNILLIMSPVEKNKCQSIEVLVSFDYY